MLTLTRKKEHLFKEDLLVATSYRKTSVFGASF